jgi:hypothetical protein
MSQEYNIIYPAISSAGVYFFNTDGGINYEVRFGRKQDNILHATIVFGVTNDEFDGEEYSVTNKGELYRVMSTIVKIVKTYMSEHPKMTRYEFTGISKDEESEDIMSARIKLYNRYVPQILPPGWHYYIQGNSIVVTAEKT